MNLSLYQKEVFNRYKSNSQIARVLTESWFDSEMYCPYCLNREISKLPNNSKSSDFLCSKCKNIFELKSCCKDFSQRVVDGEFNTMINSIQNNRVPNFSLLNYSRDEWIVKNLFIIPKFFVSISIIEKRKPLSTHAKRAGWTGCNILLNRIPEEGKIRLILNEKISSPEKVSREINKMSFLLLKNPSLRGWTSDVLKCVEEVSKEEFTLNEMYKFESYLKELYPSNNNVKAKIRQQLQILRDNNLLRFKGNGVYRKIG